MSGFNLLDPKEAIGRMISDDISHGCTNCTNILGSEFNERGSLKGHTSFTWLRHGINTVVCSSDVDVFTTYQRLE